MSHKGKGSTILTREVPSKGTSKASAAPKCSMDWPWQDGADDHGGRTHGNGEREFGYACLSHGLCAYILARSLTDPTSVMTCRTGETLAESVRGSR